MTRMVVTGAVLVMSALCAGSESHGRGSETHGRICTDDQRLAADSAPVHTEQKAPSNRLVRACLTATRRIGPGLPAATPSRQGAVPED